MLYSTGISPYLGHRGKPVENVDSLTAEILIKKGTVVRSLEELNVEPKKVEAVKVETKEVEKQIEVEKPLVPLIPKKETAKQRGRKAGSKNKK